MRIKIIGLYSIKEDSTFQKNFSHMIKLPYLSERFTGNLKARKDALTSKISDSNFKYPF